MSEIIILRTGNFIQEPKPEQNKIKLYEVIRMIKGYPLFLEDHLRRLKNSAKVMNAQLWLGDEQIIKYIYELAEANEKTEGNIKLEFEYEPLARKSQFVAKFIPHSYPTTSEYAKGVRVETMQSARSNPTAKVENLTVRQKADEQIIDHNLYEVLLENEDGYVTEGSRSNIFFIRDNKIYTAPSTDILHGITYLKVLEFCVKSNITTIEEKISAKDLTTFHSAFITGTSPMVLPIQSINGHAYTVHSILMQEITQGYQQMVSNYIQSKRNGSK